jgi:hypothetical protein
MNSYRLELLLERIAKAFPDGTMISIEYDKQLASLGISKFAYFIKVVCSTCLPNNSFGFRIPIRTTDSNDSIVDNMKSFLATSSCTHFSF